MSESYKKNEDGTYTITSQRDGNTVELPTKYYKVQAPSKIYNPTKLFSRKESDQLWQTLNNTSTNTEIPLDDFCDFLFYNFLDLIPVMGNTFPDLENNVMYVTNMYFDEKQNKVVSKSSFEGLGIETMLVFLYSNEIYRQSIPTNSNGTVSTSVITTPPTQGGHWINKYLRYISEDITADEKKKSQLTKMLSVEGNTELEKFLQSKGLLVIPPAKETKQSKGMTLFQMWLVGFGIFLIMSLLFVLTKGIAYRKLLINE